MVPSNSFQSFQTGLGGLTMSVFWGQNIDERFQPRNSRKPRENLRSEKKFSDRFKWFEFEMGVPRRDYTTVWKRDLRFKAVDFPLFLRNLKSNLASIFLRIKPSCTIVNSSELWCIHLSFKILSIMGPRSDGTLFLLTPLKIWVSILQNSLFILSPNHRTNRHTNSNNIFLSFARMSFNFAWNSAVKFLLLNFSLHSVVNTFILLKLNIFPPSQNFWQKYCFVVFHFSFAHMKIFTWK